MILCKKSDQKQETRNQIAGNTFIHCKVTIECVICTHIATLTGVTHDSCVKAYKSKLYKNEFQCLDITNSKGYWSMHLDNTCLFRSVILDALQHENIAQLNLKSVYIYQTLRKDLENKYERNLQKQHQIS